MFGGDGGPTTLIKIAKSEFVRLMDICISWNFIVKQIANNFFFSIIYNYAVSITNLNS